MCDADPGWKTPVIGNAVVINIISHFYLSSYSLPPFITPLACSHCRRARVWWRQPRTACRRRSTCRPSPRACTPWRGRARGPSACACAASPGTPQSGPRWRASLLRSGSSAPPRRPSRPSRPQIASSLCSTCGRYPRVRLGGRYSCGHRAGRHLRRESALSGLFMSFVMHLFCDPEVPCFLRAQRRAAARSWRHLRGSSRPGRTCSCARGSSTARWTSTWRW